MVKLIIFVKTNQTSLNKNNNFKNKLNIIK